jgi:hypothetical protein
MKWFKEKIILFIFLITFNNLFYAQNVNQVTDISKDFKILAQFQSRTLNVPYIQQPPNTQWCWAASVAMVLGSYGLNVQCDQVVMAIFHVLNPNQTGTENDILQGLALGGVSYRIVPGYLSFTNVKKLIDQGSPIIVCYQGSFAGHAVVLVGYNSTN